jgi:molybdate transport system ATP-binding protein
MSVLQFDCRFSYPAGFALDVAFEIGAGMTALVGPSGSGKTTTLHLIAGVLRPSAGRIVLGDRPLFDSSRRIHVPLHQRRVGLVFQDYQLFPHLTVLGNLKYGATRATAPAIDLNHLVDVLELRALLGRFPATLSGGQRQRVALGRAIASNPSILLLDEPVSALDEVLKGSILDYLAETLRAFPVPTLLVTHDVPLAERISAGMIRLPSPNDNTTPPE